LHPPAGHGVRHVSSIPSSPSQARFPVGRRPRWRHTLRSLSLDFSRATSPWPVPSRRSATIARLPVPCCHRIGHRPIAAADLRVLLRSRVRCTRPGVAAESWPDAPLGFVSPRGFDELAPTFPERGPCSAGRSSSSLGSRNSSFGSRRFRQSVGRGVRLGTWPALPRKRSRAATAPTRPVVVRRLDSSRKTLAVASCSSRWCSRAAPGPRRPLPKSVTLGVLTRVKSSGEARRQSLSAIVCRSRDTRRRIPARRSAARSFEGSRMAEYRGTVAVPSPLRDPDSDHPGARASGRPFCRATPSGRRLLARASVTALARRGFGRR
jgi:hypothetical protein